MNDTQSKIALITGATGFVGSHLARRLVRDGWQVHVVVRPASSLKQLKEAEGQVIVHRHDGTTEGMLSIMHDAHPEIVFHLASLFISEHQSKDVIALFQSNLLYGTQLLEAMKQVRVTRMVNTGTSWQHYQNEEYNPVNLYSATKQAFENILRYYLETTDLKAITLKLFDTYGQDDPRPKLINLLKKAADTGETLAMSSGEQLIDLVHVEDVVEAFVVAAKRLVIGEMVAHEAFAVSSRAPLSLKEVVQCYCAATGKLLTIHWGERPYRVREVMVPWNRGDTLPGWHPRCDLLDGFKSLLFEMV